MDPTRRHTAGDLAGPWRPYDPSQDQEPPELYRAIVAALAKLAETHRLPRQRAPWPGFLPRRLAAWPRRWSRGPDPSTR